MIIYKTYCELQAEFARTTNAYNQLWIEDFTAFHQNCKKHVVCIGIRFNDQTYKFIDMAPFETDKEEFVEACKKSACPFIENLLERHNFIENA